MSSNTSMKYPLLIENSTITDNILQFTVVNNTGSECNIFLNETLIETTTRELVTFSINISDMYISIIRIKAETSDKFVLKTLNRDLSNYFHGLKKTLRGKDDFFFLVNDKNNEIRQHYDNSYNCNLDLNRFRQSTLSKRRYLESKDINYGLFVVPDKCITLRDKLPFRTNSPYRHTDNLSDVLYDLDCVISSEDRYKNDTHISSKSSLKIVSHMISIIHNSSFDDIFKCLNENTHLERENHLGDLFNFQNWSYDRDELFHDNKYVKVDVVHLNNPVKKVELSDIPEQFRYISRRESYYFRNENSISERRAIILHDSTSLLLMNALTAYYREVFFYWDHWFFNDELIEWFNPDDVLEIRTERFLDNPQYQIVDDNYVVKFPISAELKKFNVSTDKLNAELLVKDYRQLPVKSNIRTFIDDEMVCEEESSELFYKFNYSLKDYSNGNHSIRFEINTKFKYREVIRDFVLEDSLEPLFNDLKLTYKGIGDTFFIVNDKSNELRQHYDRMYVSKFNKKRFITSLTSKKKYLKKIGVSYDLFIIPDKSVVLSDYIPFKNEDVYRHVDSLNDILVDLLCVMDEEDYLLNDTNVSMCAGLKIVSHILSSLHEDKSSDEYEAEILDNLVVGDDKHRGNLFTNKSWSYPDDMMLHDKYYSVDTKSLSLKNEFVEQDIPLEFRMFSSASSQHFHNEYSVTSKKVLVLCDDSIKPLVPSLLSYYSDVFLYYDLWFFNKDLVEWFNPDDVLEIRGERTLENAQYQLVSIEDNFVIPIIRKVELFDSVKGNLSIRIRYTDLRHLPVNSDCVISVDDNVIDKRAIDGLLDVCYSIGEGRHVVEVVLEASGSTKSNVYKQVVGE